MIRVFFSLFGSCILILLTFVRMWRVWRDRKLSSGSDRSRWSDQTAIPSEGNEKSSMRRLSSLFASTKARLVSLYPLEADTYVVWRVALILGLLM